MSYGLQLFEVDPGANLISVLDAREAALVAKHPNPLNMQFALPALHQRVAEKLTDEYLILDRFDAENGSVELTHEQYGIDISILDEEISVTVPYWHKGKKARLVWEEIWRYLGLIESQTGYHTVDPQVGRVLDLSSDFSIVFSAYTEVTS